METIKNLLSGHSGHSSNETSHSTGNSTGEGSHLEKSQDNIAHPSAGHKGHHAATSSGTSGPAVLSDQSTDQEGQPLSTGIGNGVAGSEHSTATRTAYTGEGSHLAGNTAGITSSTGNPNKYGHSDITQDARNAGLVPHTGASHGSGRELAGSEAAKVTPGFAGDVLEGNQQERRFPLSSNHVSTPNKHNTISGENIGRNTAVGTAAAVTAVGEGARHHHDHRENETGLGSSAYKSVPSTGTSRQGASSNLSGSHVAVSTSNQTGVTGSGPYGTVHGPHTTHAANLLDPSLNPGSSVEDSSHHSKVHGGGGVEADHHHSSTTTSSKGHPERGSALGAGTVGAAAAVGGATYGADKHILSETHRQPNNSSVATGQSPTTNILTSENPQRVADATSGSSNRHYGRDAAVVGGAGAAGVAAYQSNEHKHDKDLTQNDREVKKQQKHVEKEERHEHQHEKGSPKERKGSILSFLHRDKSKKYTPEEEAEFDRQEREYNSAQAGKNTALDAGAVVGGTAIDKTERHNNPSKSRDIGEHLHGMRNHGVMGRSGFPGTEGFGSGTTGYENRTGSGAIHESQGNNPNKPSTHVPTTEGAVSKGVGETLHDTSNRNIAGGSGTIEADQHTGTGPNHVTSEATIDQQGRPLPTDNDLAGSNFGNKTTAISPHLGHDTGLATGTGTTTIGTSTGDAHVPASGARRAEIIDGGRKDLDGNTGVANANKKMADNY